MFQSRRRLKGSLALVTGLVIAFPLGVLAAISFSDVPPTHPFYNDIQAIANAGVTTGCGGGKYCPDDNVTRGQMAAFMNRLGALGPGKTPVVNADKLDGLHGSDLYTKAQVNSLPGAHVIAFGFVNSSGTKGSVWANQGTWSSSRIGTGSYRVTLPGAAPGCVPHPLPVGMSAFGASILRLTGAVVYCLSGDTDLGFTTESAGVATDASFTFTVYGNSAPAVAMAAGTKTPASSVPAGATTCTIASSGAVTCK